MVTNIIIRILLMLLLLPMRLFSQENSVDFKIPENLKNHQFGISAPQLSPDSRFVIFSKSYEQNKDTLVVVDTKDPDGKILQFSRSHSMHFTKSGNLFFCTAKDAQLMKLPSKKSVVWKDVASAHYYGKFNQVIIKKNDSLIITDEQGKLLRTIPKIISSILRDEDFFMLLKTKTNTNYGFLGKILLIFYIVQLSSV